MLVYPAWLNALDRAVVDATYAKAFPPQSFFIGRHTGPLDLSQWFAESVAIEHVVTVAQAVASRLPQPFPEDRRHDLEQFLAQIILAGATRRRSPASPVPDFEATVKATLAWPSPARAQERRTPTRTRRDASSLKAERERVVLPLLEEADWTPTRWATKAGVNPHVTLGYLDGTSTPQKTNRTRITYVLAKALNRPALRLPD